MTHTSQPSPPAARLSSPLRQRGALLSALLSPAALALTLAACEDPRRASQTPGGEPAGAQVVEAGTQITDAGTQITDAGTQMTDAGTQITDAGVTPPEGGAPVPPSPTPPMDCLTNEDFFEEQVWRPVIRPLCLDCHNPQGAAQGTEMVFFRDAVPDAAAHNYEAFAHIAEFDRSGTPLVLLKPIGQLAHGGGVVIEEAGLAYEALREMVERARDPNPVVCAEEVLDDARSIFNGVRLLDPQRTLRRAALSLAGRLPTAEEEEAVERDGLGGLELALTQLLRSRSFEVRLKEVWNDILLTDKYLGGAEAIDLLPAAAYPYARWFMGGDGVTAGTTEADIWAATSFTNNSLAREPLEHIAFVVREGRPFTDVIAADYIAMNPFTARLYGVTDIEWADPLDPNEYREGRAPGIPHAGILSSPMYLNRYPTTETNRNRHRARIFFKQFLDVDVFKIAERPIDPTSTAHNPTMNDPQCSICHTVIDPVAGAFQHWTAAGSYEFRDAWYGDMRAPGYGTELLPYEERPQSLSWLGRRAAQEPGFDRAITRLMYQAFVGAELMSAPEEGEFLEERTAAFDEQQRWFNDVAAGFRANHHDLRWLLKAIARSPYFRAEGLEDPADATPARLAQLAHVGVDAPLTPEQLNRKLYAATGVRWRPNATSADSLLNANEYRLLYGGIDSDDVVERIRTPNGIFANIQRRMANEVACKVTAYDFTRPAAERFLFPRVEAAFTPEDANGFPIPQAQELIRDNLRHLAWRLWGERLGADDEELTQLYDVWYGAWRLLKTAAAEGRASSSLYWGCQGRWDPSSGVELPAEQRLGSDPQLTVRAWEALIAYMLNDYAFLYE